MQPGFALTGGIQYFTVKDQHIPQQKSATSQMYQLLFCLTGSKKHTGKCSTERESVACVYLWL